MHIVKNFMKMYQDCLAPWNLQSLKPSILTVEFKKFRLARKIQTCISEGLNEIINAKLLRIIPSTQLLLNKKYIIILIKGSSYGLLLLECELLKTQTISY